MRVNEVRKTETIEKLVRIEYIAEDGTVFRSEEECKKYEESALFVISKMCIRDRLHKNKHPFAKKLMAACGLL